MNTFDEIIQTKAYSDLTSNELEVIHELVSSEEEYNEMKSFYTGIDQLAISNRAEVSPAVKSSLNSVFQAKHPGISQNWNAPAEVEEKKIIPLYNRTWFRVAAILVIASGVTTVWVSMSENQLTTNEKTQITASNDSISKEEKKEVQPKKKFPLNEGDEKAFTAASSVPTDEKMELRTSITTNGSGGFINAGTRDKSIKQSIEGIYMVPSPSAKTYSFSDNDGKKEKEEEKNTYSKAGLDADLNPGGFYAESAKDYKPSILTTDLLSLIEPSF